MIVPDTTYSVSDLKVAIDFYDAEIAGKQQAMINRRLAGTCDPFEDVFTRELKTLVEQRHLLQLQFESQVRVMGTRLRHAANDILNAKLVRG